MDVPAEHLNLLKPNPPLDLNSLSLVVKGTLVVESSLAILPFILYACKLVIVAWLNAYGAATKPRAPCGTAATW